MSVCCIAALIIRVRARQGNLSHPTRKPKSQYQTGRQLLPKCPKRFSLDETVEGCSTSQCTIKVETMGLSRAYSPPAIRVVLWFFMIKILRLLGPTIALIVDVLLRVLLLRLLS